MNRLMYVSSLTLCVACASANLTVVRPLGAPLREVSLKVERSNQMSDEQQSRMRTLLTSSLSEAGVTVRPDAVGLSELGGDIQRYSPGNRALRYFIGFGAGRGAFDSTWRVVDGSGQELGACRVDGSVVMGVFGGSYDDVLEKVGDRLGEFLTGSK